MHAMSVSHGDGSLGMELRLTSVQQQSDLNAMQLSQCVSHIDALKGDGAQSQKNQPVEPNATPDARPGKLGRVN